MYVLATAVRTVWIWTSVGTEDAEACGMLEADVIKRSRRTFDFLDVERKGTVGVLEKNGTGGADLPNEFEVVSLNTVAHE